MSQDREEELKEVEAARYREMQGLLGKDKSSESEMMGPLPHDRVYFLALGFMSYILEGEANPRDVELLADLLRQEALR